MIIKRWPFHVYPSHPARSRSPVGVLGRVGSGALQPGPAVRYLQHAGRLAQHRSPDRPTAPSPLARNPATVSDSDDQGERAPSRLICTGIALVAIKTGAAPIWVFCKPVESGDSGSLPEVEPGVGDRWRQPLAEARARRRAATGRGRGASQALTAG